MITENSKMKWYDLENMKCRMPSIGGEFEMIPVKKGFHIKFDLNL
jgi:signal transduction histidine kinase